MDGEIVTWSAEIRQAWAAVPVHAVVQFIRDGELHLWWRHGEQGKVFATRDGDKWTWAFRRRDDGLLSGGGWTWDRERDDIRDFVVIARGITPDLSNEEVERRCTVQNANTSANASEWIAWDDVPVDSLVYAKGGGVALRRADKLSFWAHGDGDGSGWRFGTKQTWSAMAADGGQCKIIARNLTPDQMMDNLKSLARAALSRDELALVGLT